MRIEAINMPDKINTSSACMRSLRLNAVQREVTTPQGSSSHIGMADRPK